MRVPAGSEVLNVNELQFRAIERIIFLGVGKIKEQFVDVGFVLEKLTIYPTDILTTGRGVVHQPWARKDRGSQST